MGLPSCRHLDSESEPCCIVFIPHLLPFLPNLHHGIDHGPTTYRTLHPQYHDATEARIHLVPILPLAFSLCPPRWSMSLPCIRPSGVFTVPHGPSQPELHGSSMGTFYSVQTKLTPFPRPNLDLLTSILCSSSECLPYWDPNLLFEILSTKVQFKDHRVQSARRCQLTAGKSGKPNLIICVVHSICSSLIQTAVPPRTWVCSWEKNPIVLMG